MNNSTVENSPLLQGESTFFQCLYVINMLFGFPINFYVLWLIIKGPSSITLEFFNLNLSVCEIGICLSSLSRLFGYYYYELLNLKQFVWFLEGLTITGRPLFQCLMCVERYLAVVHPVTFLKYKPLRYRVFCCAVAWILILGSCLFCMYTVIKETKIVLYLYFFSIQFLIYLFIKFFCLVAVVRALKQSGPGERRKEKENNMKRRAFHLILITNVSMSIIYIPLMISGFTVIFANNFLVDLLSIGFLCFVLAGFVQPLLYLHRSAKINFACFIKSIQLFKMMRSNNF